MRVRPRDRTIFHSERSKVKVIGVKNSVNLGQISLFPDDNSTAISVMVIKLHGKLPLIWVKNPIDFEGHRSKVKVTGVKNSVNLGPISPFPDDNSTVISVMVIKLYGKLTLVWVKNPIVFEGQRSRSQGSNTLSTWAQFLRFWMIMQL